MTDRDPQTVARGLTKAQREGLLRKPCPSWWGAKPGAFPSSRNTARCLIEKGLGVRMLATTSAFELTELGLAVRAVLQRQEKQG